MSNVGVVSNFDIQQQGVVGVKGALAAVAPGPALRYLRVAERLAVGLRPLAAAGPTCNTAIAFLAAQVTETALKAHLLKTHTSAEMSRSPDRHSLAVLWSRAVGEGLSLADSPTPAISLLVSLHSRPYPLRYSDKSGTQLTYLPSGERLVEEVEQVLGAVRSSLRAP